MVSLMDVVINNYMLYWCYSEVQVGILSSGIALRTLPAYSYIDEPESLTAYYEQYESRGSRTVL
jgi:hypothetical protein